MREKDFNRWSKKIGKTLPEDFYYVYEKELKDVWVRKNEQGEEEIVHPKKDESKEGLITQKRWITNIVPHIMNHGRRIKRLWQKTKSWQEINNYLAKYNMELKYDNI